MRPAYLSSKPSLYGAGQRKYNNLNKFQTGTTTTFGGYTNMTGHRHHNLPPAPRPRLNPPPSHHHNHHHIPRHQHSSNNNNNNIYNNNNPYHAPPRHNTRSYYHAQLYHPNHHYFNRARSLSRSRFHALARLPSRSPSPSYHRHAPPIKPRQHLPFNNNRRSYNVKSNDSVNARQGVILSDSMCSRVRTYAIRKFNLVNVELSYESGCDIYKMMHWLNTPQGASTVGNKDFLLISLGTNDVGRYGVDVSLKRCSELIKYIRRSFPGIRAIGWLALSPRWKPTRFISGAEIGELHHQFNEHLQVLSKQLDFDFVDARLGPADMRVEDGLHPSTTTGRWKFEGALREWFTARAVSLHSSSFQPHHTTATTAFNNNNLHPATYHHNHIRTSSRPSYHHHNNRAPSSSSYNRQNRSPSPSPYHHNRHNRSPSPSPYRHHHNRQNYHHPHHHYNNLRNISPSTYAYRQTYNYQQQPNIRSEQHSHNQNSTQPFIVTTENRIEQSGNRRPNIPSRALIKFYPHKLQTIEQYFRENQPPPEVETEKEKLFLAANLYYQSRYFKVESRKWQIYDQVSNRKKEKVFTKDGDDILMEEIPIARPFRDRHENILNTTVSDSDSQSNRNSDSISNSNHSSDTENDDKKKRKLTDTSLSPTGINNNKITEINLKKKKQKSKKKTKIAIDKDPRAPEGSPVLVVNDSNRPGTPIDPSARTQRLFSNFFKQQREVAPSHECLTQSVRVAPDLPKTPPGLPAPPVLSPRESTPRSPLPPRQTLIVTSINETIHLEGERNHPVGERIHPQIDEFHPSTTAAQECHAPMEQEIIHLPPAVTSKDAERGGVNRFDFPIIPIECQFYFKIYRQTACAENITHHREFLEKKSLKAEIELEQLMTEFDPSKHRTVVQYIKNSIEPLIDILEISNQKRLDNLVLDQIREKAIRSIRNKASQVALEHIGRAQNKFERSLELKFQLDKLDRRLNENMPPPALNIMDRLEFRSQELSNESKEQYSEQWKSVIRKSKLDLTSIMRLAKVAEIDKSEKEHIELVEKIPVELRNEYKEIIHTIQVRQDRVVQKKLNFLEKRAQRTIKK